MALGVVVCMTAPVARAAELPAAQVERLAKEAAIAFKGADYQRAVELLERAYQIRQVANILYNIARSYDKLGEVEKAIEHYRRYADSSDADPKLKAKAEARLQSYEESHRPKPGPSENPPV